MLKKCCTPSPCIARCIEQGGSVLRPFFLPKKGNNTMIPLPLPSSGDVGFNFRGNQIQKQHNFILKILVLLIHSQNIENFTKRKLLGEGDRNVNCTHSTCLNLGSSQSSLVIFESTVCRVRSNGCVPFTSPKSYIFSTYR